LVGAGLAAWKSSEHRGGIELTDAGRKFIAALAGQTTSPPTEEAPLLAFQPSKRQIDSPDNPDGAGEGDYEQERTNDEQ
jgi:hypothetical protein